MIVVIFLFLASFRSVVIPIVTIPLSLIGVLQLMLAMGIQYQSADAACHGCWRSVSWSTTPSWWWRISTGIWRRGKPPVQARDHRCARDRGASDLDDDHARCRYAPIGFLGGLTGALFREFAFYAGGLGDRCQA